jgi:4-amino-4-deoxy-L-arabinose transferase-like glycosyltransferase
MSEPISKAALARYNLVLLLIVTGLYFLNYYNGTLFFRPCSIHQWRQADCLSIAKNYYEQGMHFFHPEIHYQGVPGGRAVSEMPLLNFTAALLWKIFGEHEFIYRLLEYFIFLAALFVLFNTLLVRLRSPLVAYFSTCVLLTSPLLTYYSFSFIADVPAFSMGLIAFCLFFHFYEEGRTGNFWLSLAFATVAVLIKASALVPLSLICFFSLASVTGACRYLGTRKLFERRLAPVLGMVFSVGCVFSWYAYAKWYNGPKNDVFLLKLLPMWEMSEEEIVRNFRALFNLHLPQFLNKCMLFLFIIAVFFMFSVLRKLPSFFRWAFVLSFTYFMVYIFLFFQVFSVHDYYLNNLHIAPVITFAGAGAFLAGTGAVSRYRKFFASSFLVCFIFSSFHAAAWYRLRMFTDDNLVEWFPTITKEERELYAYLAWDYSTAIKRVEDFRPVLRVHGVKREDLTLSIPDMSFDVSLYFMDQKGFDLSREDFSNNPGLLRWFLVKQPIKYVVLSDSTLKSLPGFKIADDLLEPFFIHKGVQVYKRRN